MPRFMDMSFYYDQSVVPFSAKDAKAIKALHLAALNTVGSLTPSELGSAINKFGAHHAKQPPRYRINWYGRLGLIKFTDPLPTDTLKTSYRIAIQKKALAELVELLESIHYYGTNAVTKTIIHIAHYLYSYPQLKKEWIDTETIESIMPGNNHVFKSSKTYGTFSTNVSKSDCPLDRAFIAGQEKALLYGINGKARKYLDTWKQIRQWIDDHSTSHTVTLHTARGAITYNGQMQYVP